MKRMITLFMGTLIVLSLSACSNKNNGGESSASSTDVISTQSFYVEVSPPWVYSRDPNYLTPSPYETYPHKTRTTENGVWTFVSSESYFYDDKYWNSKKEHVIEFDVKTTHVPSETNKAWYNEYCTFSVYVEDEDKAEVWWDVTGAKPKLKMMRKDFDEVSFQTATKVTIKTDDGEVEFVFNIYINGGIATE